MNDHGKAIHSRLAMLVECGADRFNPVRFVYIESLARRAAEKQEPVSRMITQKVSHAITQYQKHFEQAREDALGGVSFIVKNYPDSSDRAHRLFERCDFNGLQKLKRYLTLVKRKEVIASLLDEIEKSDPDPNDNDASLSFEVLLKRQEDEILQSVASSSLNERPALTENKPELKTFYLFKETWTKFYTDRLVKCAIDELPENAGPLNSQMLVTHLLFSMRKLSPAYFNRFISYLETMLWMEQAIQDIKP